MLSCVDMRDLMFRVLSQGYINRVRGYHAQKDRAFGYEHGMIDSFYYTPEDDRWLKPKRNIMRSYHAIRQGFWSQEFPVAWRDIDFGVVRE